MHDFLVFNNEKLFLQALTHRSYVNEHPQCGGSNERLEFLGDAILSFISGEYLYQKYPDIDEGEMTRRRSALVDEKQLAKFAMEIGLDHQMLLGHGVAQARGHQNPNLLSSTFEAIVGAYYLDYNCDLERLRILLKKLFDSVPLSSSVDVKNRLQQFSQSHSKNPPRYETGQVAGVDHAPVFLSKVYIGEHLVGGGQGQSKKAAEKEAAADAIDKLREKGFLPKNIN
jgi:ribonuclease III